MEENVALLEASAGAPIASGLAGRRRLLFHIQKTPFRIMKYCRYAAEGLFPSR
jgi:hypothetical protein